ncbi:MAG: YciI family protein, partial [Mycobacterium sp.]
MQYFALLISKERDLTPDEGAAEMAAYENFHAKALPSIRAGDALLSAATGVRITGGPDAPTVTDGPFAESAEVAGGYYVFEADNLDDALALARDIPAAKHGAVEVWPMAGPGAQSEPLEGTNWIALLLEPPERPVAPGTPEWEAMVALHQTFFAGAGQHIKA